MPKPQTSSKHQSANATTAGLRQVQHPETAPGGWKLHCIVYDDGAACIAVGLLERDGSQALGLRWNGPLEYARPDGSKATGVSAMGDETGWFILPFDFGAAVGKALIERHTAGLRCFDSDGFKCMVEWLRESEAIADSLSY